MAKTSDSASNAPKERRNLFSRKPKTPKPDKQPGRMKQMLDVFKMTRRYDPSVVWLMLLVFLGVIALALIISFFFFNNNWITALILGIPLGLLGALLILSRRAERAAFSQIEGKPGASGAALNTLRRGWVIEEQPVAVNPRSQDAVFRAVGRPGVVLVTEGAPHRVRTLVEAERKKLGRILPNVSVHVIQSGREEGQVELSKVAKQVKKLKNELTKAEVNAVSKRIASLGGKLPIPKGVDPYKARPDRKAARGR
ncbi:DUF4191 domain-containing protein [Psychromicrobium lacuslunae]|uniref:Membrane protein n=1 Tax=Psychromicrobium lacuslunae TaxID=1618207 RepID=A0A0D4BXA5_9MICC|nr:DUF4191 domain-containing protein [Psychromicrobium lacuslunae]AJT40746.1 membrane protein [Psychromicrobium lacuslunae]